MSESVFQLYDGIYPAYTMIGYATKFKDICEWKNISAPTVRFINLLEEICFAWGFINLATAGDKIDYNLFPPKKYLNVFLVWLSKKLYTILIRFRFYRKHYDDV